MRGMRGSMRGELFVVFIYEEVYEGSVIKDMYLLTVSDMAPSPSLSL
jgi:hypothetical protein